ncbi:MAG: hypothetical protein CL753_04500 [Chloroflexi bacterium]|nr:hypothetical protein [Chloroflexota bacterium]
MPQSGLVELVMVLVIAVLSASVGIYIWLSLSTEQEIAENSRSVPSPNLNQDLLIGLFENYLVSDPPDGFCLAGMSQTNTYGPLWLWRQERWHELRVTFKDHLWVVKASGIACDGVETWHVNDVTGHIAYQGSSTVSN